MKYQPYCTSLIGYSFVFILYYHLIPSCLAEPKPNGSNVCNRTVDVKKEKWVEEPVEYNIDYYTLCGFTKCQKSRTEKRINTWKKYYYVQELVYNCCPGYAEMPDQECAPICTQGCKNGKCIAPNTCSTDEEARSMALKIDHDDISPNQISPPTMTNEPYSYMQIALNCSFIMISLMLLIAVIQYRKRLNNISRALYENAFQSSSDSSSGNSGPQDSSVYYGDASYYSEIGAPPSTISRRMQNRPLVPLPGDVQQSGEQLSKNLNFASATRQIIKGEPVLSAQISSQNHPSVQPLRKKFLFDPIVESRLARCDEKSEDNIYSEIGDNKLNASQDSISSIYHDASPLERINTEPEDSLKIEIDSENVDTSHYQIPKSPASKPAPTDSNQ